MKKLAFALLSAGFVFSAVQADDTRADEEVSVEQQALENARASFSGVYLGGGVHVAGYQTRADYLYSDDNGKIVRESREDDNTKARIGGTVVLGVGKKIQQCFLALEAGADLAQNTISRQADKLDSVFNSTYSTTVTRNGVNPWFGIRAAWACERLGSLVYLKVAGNFAKDTYKHAESFKFKQYDNSGNGTEIADKFFFVKKESFAKTSKIRPEIALGLEKRYEGLGVRAELAYVIGGGSKEEVAAPVTESDLDAALKNLTDKGQNYGEANTKAHAVSAITSLVKGDKIRIKPKGGFVFRLMAVKNFNLFN